VTDADLAAFFADNAGRYEIPVRTRVDYIAFPVAPQSVAVTDEELLSTYLANPARFPAPDAAEQPADAAQTSAFDNFAKVKPQVEAAVRAQKARRSAGQTAADLALELFENKIAPAALPDFLAKRNLTLQTAAPVGPGTTPAKLAGIPQLAETAAGLGPDRPYSDALAGNDRTVILVWRETIPARQPELAEVRAEVESDLKVARLRERLAAAGKTLRDDLSARLKTGAQFTDAATAAAKAAGLTVQTKSFAGFTFNEPPEGLDFTALNALQNLSAGDLSPVVTVSRDKALLLHVSEKQLPDLTAANPRYDEIKARIANVLAQRNGEDALAAIVDKELARTAPTTAP
ncbi:MAG: peptidyl-prolyl cis-trans isomerase, partial [Verrucomicrobiota bacterium]